MRSLIQFYVIRQIKQSDYKRKWLKYIAVIFLNTPAITYTAINGLSVKLVSFQVLLGVSFGYMGFLNSFWTFGIPLGGLFWFLKLWQEKSVIIKTDVSQSQISEENVDENKPTND